MGIIGPNLVYFFRNIIIFIIIFLQIYYYINNNYFCWNILDIGLAERRGWKSEKKGQKKKIIRKTNTKVMKKFQGVDKE